MIFVFNGNGDLLNKIPEKVHQGSNKASRIYFFAPFVENALIDVAFTLPNGELRPKRLMSRLENVTTFNGLQIDGQNVGAWVYDLPQAITTFAGNVKVQFYVTTAGELISTNEAVFTVEKGVPPFTYPEDKDTYENILLMVQSILSGVEQIIDENAIKVFSFSGFPDSFDFYDSLSLGDLFNGVDETGTQGTPPNIVILQNPDGSKKGVVISYERDEFPRAKVLVGDYIYTYILNGIEDPNIGWFSKEEIGGGSSPLDVQINGESIVNDGVANIPIASNTRIGVLKGNNYRGTQATGEGDISIMPATDSEIPAKTQPYHPITPAVLDLAVKVGVTTNTIVLTDEEKAAAQAWLGVKKLYKHRLDLTDNDAMHNISLYADTSIATAIPITEIETLNKVFKGVAGGDTNTGVVVVFDQITETGDGYYAQFFTTDSSMMPSQIKINTTISVGTTVITEI